MSIFDLLDSMKEKTGTVKPQKTIDSQAQNDIAIVDVRAFNYLTPKRLLAIVNFAKRTALIYSIEPMRDENMNLKKFHVEHRENTLIVVDSPNALNDWDYCWKHDEFEEAIRNFNNLYGSGILQFSPETKKLNLDSLLATKKIVVKEGEQQEINQAIFNDEHFMFLMLTQGIHNVLLASAISYGDESTENEDTTLSPLFFK